MKNLSKRLLLGGAVMGIVSGAFISIPSLAQGYYVASGIGAVLLVTGLILLAFVFED